MAKTVSVALLRGVNVGGKNKLAMAELSKLFQSFDIENVRTFIQSGNVIFTHTKRLDGARIEKAIADQFTIATTAIVRSLTQMESVVARNPFPKMDVGYLHVGFSNTSPFSETPDMDHKRYLPDHFSIAGDHLYLYVPTSMATSKLPSYLGRQFKVAMTLRNWNTVNRLIELMKTKP